MLKILTLLLFTAALGQTSVVDSVLASNETFFRVYYDIAKRQNAELNGMSHFKVKIVGGDVTDVALIFDTTYDAKLLGRLSRALTRLKFSDVDTLLNYLIIFD